MTDEFDVVVLGGGPAGESASGRCAKGGLNVALVETELVGGECSYWGCIPSKTLIRPGDVLAAARRAPGAAEAVTGPLDAAAAFTQRDYMVNNWSDESAAGWLDDEGITLVRGRGMLAGERQVAVEASDGSTRTLQARRAVVLSTGTSAAIPPVEGLGDVSFWDNRGATEAKDVPRRLLVLGGGAVGAEMAQAFRRLGSDEVTVVEGGERLLAHEEPFAGDEVQAAFEAEGIRVVTGMHVAAVERSSPGAAVVATLEDGQELEGDEILVAVGRRPRTDDLGLDRVGLDDKAGGYLDVDDHMRVEGVDGDWLYAVGDCNGRALLTHMGKYQARICASVICGADADDLADHGVVPRVVFTDPQVCAVGLTERQAREYDFAVQAVSIPTGSVPGAYTQGNDISGTSHLVFDADRRVLVGATFTGPNVQELLHSATVAIVGEVMLDRLWHAVPSFPTVSEVWLRLLEECGL